MTEIFNHQPSLHCTRHWLWYVFYPPLHPASPSSPERSNLQTIWTDCFLLQTADPECFDAETCTEPEREADTNIWARDDHLTQVYRDESIFTTQSEFCRFLNRFTRFCTMHILSLRSSATRPNISTKSWSLMCWTRWSRAINTPVLPTPALHIHTLHTCVSNSHICKTKNMKKYCHLK